MGTGSFENDRKKAAYINCLGTSGDIGACAREIARLLDSFSFFPPLTIPYGQNQSPMSPGTCKSLECRVFFVGKSESPCPLVSPGSQSTPLVVWSAIGLRGQGALPVIPSLWACSVAPSG
jgi:hypothetical protein